MNKTSSALETQSVTLNTSVTIINQLGLHTRAAAKLVGLAGGFQSQIDIVRKDNGQKANCKSIMAIMLLGVTYGTTLDLIISGEDAQEAKAAIIDLIQNRFGEAE